MGKMVKAILKLMIKHSIGPVVFEISRSEMEYTDQKPDEFAVAVFAGAIKEGYKGPVFMQGDHFQFSAKKYKEDQTSEMNRIKDLIKESIAADFQNIDIDGSTLVDLSKPTLNEQQVENYKVTAELTGFIRSLETKGTISVGAEIGHIGDKNSTPEDLEAFMEGYLKLIGDKIGISKVSVQTGTSHGGIPLADGTIAKVNLDFNVIENVGKLAREKYHIGGVVQHGASTLPNELFSEFPKHKTLEIHLATGFQNIIFDNMNTLLREEIYKWILENCKAEWEKDWNQEQFIYKLRKKSIGPFKEKLWYMPDIEKLPIVNALEKQLLYLFEKLNVLNTRGALLPYV
jgi:fructose/tagatose bisphosphate aldolase